MCIEKSLGRIHERKALKNEYTKWNGEGADILEGRNL
jgi:hypothetical protein